MDFSNVTLGNKAVSAIHLGNIQIWPSGTPPTPASISIFPEFETVSALISTGSISVTASTTWDAYADVDWILISKTGNTQLDWTCGRNRTGATRRGAIYFTIDNVELASCMFTQSA